MSDPLTIDPARKCELALCRSLQELLPVVNADTDLTFFPTNGLTGDDGRTAVEAGDAYAVVSVVEIDVVIPEESVHQMDVRVVIVTSIGGPTPERHAALVRQTRDAILTFRQSILDSMYPPADSPFPRAPIIFDDLRFSIHGLDLMPGEKPVDDDRGQGRATVLVLSLGCQG